MIIDTNKLINFRWLKIVIIKLYVRIGFMFCPTITVTFANGGCGTPTDIHYSSYKDFCNQFFIPGVKYISISWYCYITL